MSKLSDNNKFKELDKKQNTDKHTKSIIRKISTSKSLLISAKVNPKQYEMFKKINAEKGVSNNSIINLLISNYNARNKSYLDEDFVIKGYMLANVGLRYESNRFGVEASCYNLLDHRYVLGGDRVPVPQAGRMFFGTLHVKF